MDEKNNEGEKLDEVMLPGFRFHPTDEELVGFYLKRKIQQRPLSIELIKQLDIYKYDPWDLPKLASGGEKEWYFYCPRDRKYRNSARPNRVTGTGFWKATGTDRPIYSSEGSKCIGLKKSLVFYKGRAAKGVKTDWMMHEFRLPSLSHSSLSKTSSLDKTFPANDSWAICRIFKKTSPITPRTMSHSWVSPSLPEPNNPTRNNPNFSPENIVKTSCSSPIQLNSSNFNELEKFLQSPNNFSFLDHHVSTFKPTFPTSSNYISHNTSTNENLLPNIETLLDLPPSYILPQLEESSDEHSKSNNIDISSMLLSMSSSVHEDMELGMLPNMNGQCHEFSLEMLHQDQMQHINNNGDNQQDFACALLGNLNNMVYAEDDAHHQWDGIESIGSIPISGLFPLAMPEAWKSSSTLMWDCAPPLS